MAEPESPRFVFDPLVVRGVAGLRPAQVGVLGCGLGLATVLLRVLDPGAGSLAAVALAVAAAVVAFVPVGGRPVEQWAPALARHGAVRLLAGPGRSLGRRPPAPVQPPPSLRGLRFRQVYQPDGRPVGLIIDRARGVTAAVIAVQGRAFALLDPGDKARRLQGWSAVLAGLAREDKRIVGLQWVERSVPGDGAALTRHFQEGCVLAESHPAVTSYAELVAAAGPVATRHETLVVLGVDTRRAGDDMVCREVRLLEGQLRTAELDVVGALSARQIGAALRHGFDPWCRADLAARAAAHPDLAGACPERAWPSGSATEWSVWRADATWHATFWVAEWPRSEVGPDFLSPLLLAGAQRTVAVSMAPLAPSAGVREVESARTAHAADDALRQRAGFLATARRSRQAEGALRRESELADGHAAYRFSGYVTVSARSLDQLEDECAAVVQAAHQARLELRRLYGAQDVAFTWTLPLGRGLARR